MAGEPIYREGWKEIPPARPVTQEHVSHPDLLLSLHGPGRDGLKKSHHDEIDGDPYYIWSGKCDGSWAMCLRHRRVLIDFDETGMVRCLSKQSGGHGLRLIVKPVDGPWLVSEQSADASDEWLEFEFRPRSLSWRLLDMEKVRVMGKVPTPSLARIDAIGFTDLKAGAGSDACSRLAWIEVWGGRVPRAAVLEG
ncbi:MAG: hypothetical protein WCF16_08715 [Alphaproteobacteria bacterium]